jgi:P-type E1-E2 ATPase
MVAHYAAAAERFSEHPIAQAIAAAANNGSSLGDAVETTTAAGYGISAIFSDGTCVRVGTETLMRDTGVEICPSLQAEEQRLITSGKTASFTAVNGRAIGVIGVSDALRPEATDTVSRLRRSGLHIALLTGDNEGSAAQVSKTVGITDVRSRLLPEQKLTIVEHRAKEEKVAFVGDGLNDAPALAAASVGIALRGTGIAASLEAADIVVMGDDLTRLPLLLDLARATQTAIRWNLIFSVGTMAALLIGSVLGSLSLAAGILAHEGGTLLVLMNGLRLLSPRLTPLTQREFSRLPRRGQSRKTRHLPLTFAGQAKDGVYAP